jgi:hypothetical protein
MSGTTIYSHPDGHEIAVGNGLLTACTSEGTAVSIPIGHAGLADMGRALLECAVAAAQDESEKDGAELGMGLLQELLELRGRPQAESFQALHAALLALAKLEYPDPVPCGYAGLRLGGQAAMSWRRGRAYAQDLRDRVLASPGLLREVAERFGVSQAYVSRVRSRHERLGETSAGAQCNHVPLRLAALSEPLLAQVAKAPEQTLAQLGNSAGGLERHYLGPAHAHQASRTR